MKVLLKYLLTLKSYFDYATKKLELDNLSITNFSLSNIQIECTVKNADDTIKDVDFSEFKVQLRKKEEQNNWTILDDAGYYEMYFDENGAAYIWIDMENTLEPSSEYEVRLVSSDASIVYGEAEFTPTGNWNIYSASNYQYNYEEKDKSPYISISGNLNIPEVKPEDETIVKIKETRKSRIYLDIQDVGTTKLQITADGITKEVEVTVSLGKNLNLVYLEGADESLADIPLSEGYSWVDPTISPKADDNNKEQNFEIHYKNGDIEKTAPVPVAVGKLNDIVIKGKDTVGVGKERIYSVYYSSVGYDVNDGKRYEITQKWSGNENLQISGNDSERNVTVKGGNTAGSYEIELTVTVKNLFSQKTYKEKVKHSVRVIGQGLIDNLIIRPADKQPEDAIPHVVSGSVVSGAIIEIDYEDYDKDARSKVQLEAFTDTGSGEQPADVSWSADTPILEVNDTGLVTIKDMGSAQVNVTAKDDGKYQEPVLFKICNYAPVFPASFVVNKNNTDGTRLTYEEQNDNTVTNIALKESHQKLEVFRKSGDSDWYIRVKAGSEYATMTTENVTLEVTTERRKYTRNIKVIIAESLEAIPEIHVTGAYVKGLEVECKLNGEINKNDNYTYEIAVCYDSQNDSWSTSERKAFEESNQWTAKDLVKLDGIISGQTQKWKYQIYKNDTLCHIENFDYATKKLDLTISSVTDNGNGGIAVEYAAANLDDTIKNAYIDKYAIQVQKKGSENWVNAGIDANLNKLNFDENGYGSLNIDMGNILEVSSEYEIRFISSGDENVVYGRADFTTQDGTWDIPSEITYQYDEVKNNSPYISISGRYVTPTVEVENEDILKIKQISDMKIYLDILDTGTTKLYVTASGITKEVKITVSLGGNLALFYLEGADKSLADIPLPEKFSWVDPTISPSADDDSKEQKYAVKYEDGTDVKYAFVSVAVCRVEDIVIKGKASIGAGKSRVYSAYYSSTGYDLNDSKAFEITQKWTENENLLLSGDDSGRNITVVGGNTAGTYELKLEVAVKNHVSQKVYEKTVTQQIRVIGQGFIDNLIIKSAEKQPEGAIPHVVSGSVISGTVIEIDYANYDKDARSKVQLEAFTDTGAGVQAANVSWNADTPILEVSEAGIVTIKDSGIAQVMATAADDGKYQEAVEFRIYNYAPVFDMTSLIVNKGNAEGERLAYKEQNGNSVTDIAIKDNKSQLEVSKYQGGWYIHAKNGNTYSGTTTENITLAVTTQKREYTQDLRITIDVSVPIAKFKQTVKPNLFYAGSEAVFTVDSSYEIEDIRTAPEDAQKANFHVRGYDMSTGQLALTANALDADNVAAFAKKNSPNALANIQIKFKGYSEYVAFNNIKVSAQNKAVSLKAENAYVIETPGIALTDV